MTVSRLLWALGPLIPILVMGSAQADPSGEDLRARCERAQALSRGGIVDPFTAVTAGQCTSFVDGLASGLQVGALLRASGRSYCPPENLTTADAITIVQDYFETYPELTGEDAGILAADALMTKFPCPARGSASADAPESAHSLRGPLDNEGSHS